jgi:hypothetical protein
MRLLLPPLSALLASCGTIMNGGPFMVPVSSNPQGATVYYRSSAVGKTPCQVAMEPDDTQIRFVLEGYNAATLEVATSHNWWVLANCAFGIPGLIGVAIDYASHSDRIVDADQVSVLMTSWRAPVAVQTEPAKPPRAGNILQLSTRSKLHGKVVTVESTEEKMITVRAVDSGETDAIEIGFLHEIEAARKLQASHMSARLQCIYN